MTAKAARTGWWFLIALWLAFGWASGHFWWTTLVFVVALVLLIAFVSLLQRLVPSLAPRETPDDAAGLAKLDEKTVQALASPETHENMRPRRIPIPERVRNEVWRRDRGQCVDCGSRRNLEYDHIIPVIKGGSNTVRNIELRCEACNRRKGSRV